VVTVGQQKGGPSGLRKTYSNFLRGLDREVKRTEKAHARAVARLRALNDAAPRRSLAVHNRLVRAAATAFIKTRGRAALALLLRENACTLEHRLFDLVIGAVASVPPPDGTLLEAMLRTGEVAPVEDLDRLAQPIDEARLASHMVARRLSGASSGLDALLSAIFDESAYEPTESPAVPVTQPGGKA